MIFKRWFKPKWQHQDAAVRVKAIAELNRDSSEHKEILHELAFNDGAETVRKTALEQLNEFSLWWQASKHESAERLKQFAEQQLIGMLLDNRVSAQLKQQFINECNRSSILEKLAQTETDASLKFSLIQRLARQDLYLSGVLDPNFSAEQRMALLEFLNDDKTLEKLSRQLDGALLVVVQQKIADRLEQKQKPERVRKQVVLLLAKLNSVRERTDLADAQQRYQLHQQEWLALQADLACLPEADELHAKYQKVCTLTDQSLAPRLAQLALEQQQAQAAMQQAEQYQQLAEQITQVAQQMAQALNDGQIDQAAALQPVVDELRQQVSSQQWRGQQQQGLSKSLQALQQQLDQLPELAESLALTARLLAEQAAVQLPPADADVTAAYQAFKQFQQQWQRQAKLLKQLMPDSFSSSYQQLTSQWQQHCEPLLGQQEKLQRQLKSKMAEFKRLHQAGKYNVLFGLFKGLQRDLQQLGETSRSQLAAEFQIIEQQVQDLAELQAYIATPRKQQLVADMQELAAATDVSPNERAAQVKQSRATWNTLGRAQEDLEESLNDAFNQACELAFAPCREHFAKLDAERAQNAEVKAQIIAGLQQQLTLGLTGKELDALINQSLKSWQASGPVEKQRFDELQPQFQQLLQQLKQQQKAGQLANATAKQQLIATAIRITTDEGVEHVAAQLKALQQEWKVFGFAGKNLDQQLWQQFRAVCDQWFAKADELRAQKKQAVEQQRQQQLTELEQLQQRLTEAQTAAELTELQQLLQALSPTDDKYAFGQRKQLAQQVADRLQSLAGESVIGDYQQLFSALAQPAVQAAELPALYRLVFNQQQEKILSRADLTLALEWAAGQPSPAAEQARRQQVQMLLLTDKHNSGESISQPQLLSRWLQYGALQPDEAELLIRVRRLYLAD